MPHPWKGASPLEITYRRGRAPGCCEYSLMYPVCLKTKHGCVWQQERAQRNERNEVPGFAFCVVIRGL